MQEKYKIDDELLSKIINVAYGDAGFITKLIIWFKSGKDARIKKLLDEYKSSAKAVRKIEEEKLSSELIEKVKNKMNLYGENEKVLSKIKYAYYSLFTKPVYAAAAVTIVILAVVTFILFDHPGHEHSYTKAEIKIAQQQLEQSFAIVGKAFINAEYQLDNTVIRKHVQKPLNKSFNILNDYLIGG